MAPGTIRSTGMPWGLIHRPGCPDAGVGMKFAAVLGRFRQSHFCCPRVQVDGLSSDHYNCVAVAGERSQGVKESGSCLDQQVIGAIA